MLHMHSTNDNLWIRSMDHEQPRKAANTKHQQQKPKDYPNEPRHNPRNCTQD